MTTQDTAGDAVERLAEIEATTDYNVDIIDPPTAWVDGYLEGHRAAADAALRARRAAERVTIMCECSTCIDRRQRTEGSR